MVEIKRKLNLQETDGRYLRKVEGLKVLTIDPTCSLISSQNVEVSGDALILSAGQMSGDAVYQVDASQFTKFVKAITDTTAETVKGIDDPTGSVIAWNREYARQQVSDVYIQVATSDDGITWSDYYPDNISGATSMITQSGNTIPPRCTFLGPTDVSAYTWGTSADAEGKGFDPGFLSRHGPGDAIVISNAIQTGSYQTEIALSERAVVNGAERLTWGVYLYQAEVAAALPRSELDYMRLELQGGTTYASDYQVYPVPNSYTLDSTEYMIVNGGGFGQKAATWKFMLCSAVPPADTKAGYFRWFRSMRGIANTGMGHPFMMKDYNPVRAYDDTVITPVYTCAWDYDGIVGASGDGWQFDYSTYGGTGATVSFATGDYVWSPRQQSLKMHPTKGTGRKYVQATSPLFNIKGGMMTSLQWEQKTSGDSPDTGHGVPTIHHYQIVDAMLKFYQTNGSTLIDVMSLGRERSEFSSISSNNNTNYICQVAPVLAAKARVVFSADFNNASGCPAGFLNVNHYIDGIRVDQMSWGCTEYDTIAQQTMPRLDLPGNETTLDRWTPLDKIRVKVRLVAWDTTHGRPVFRSLKLIGV